MSLRSSSRLLAGLMAAAAVLAGGTLPAAAAPAPAVSMLHRDVLVPAGAGGARFSPLLAASEEVSLSDARVTFSLNGPGRVTLRPDENYPGCVNSSPTELVCDDFLTLDLGPDGVTGDFAGYAVAGDDAAAGATGEMTVTLTARGISPITRKVGVRVAEAVDLTAGPESELTARPGGRFDVPLTVRNSGDRAVEGVAVMINADQSIGSAEQHSNCRYRDGRLVLCEFGGTLQPGATYGAGLALDVRADAQAPSRAGLQPQWLTAAELQDVETWYARRGLTLGTAGTGAALPLTERAEVAARRVQADRNPDDNWGFVTVRITGEQGVDLSAIGSDLHGVPGNVVLSDIGARNNGPAALDRGRLNAPAAVVSVAVPAGVEVTAAPVSCFPYANGRVDFEHPGRPGQAAYRCNSAPRLEVGEEVIFSFGFRFPASERAGSVVVNEPCECEVFTGDINLANNRAPILFSFPPGGGTGAGSGDGDGDGGTLPITGPAAAGITIAGLALLAGGVLLARTARRRRTTFVS